MFKDHLLNLDVIDKVTAKLGTVLMYRKVDRLADKIGGPSKDSPNIRRVKGVFVASPQLNVPGN